ncbi:hypothetical protein F8M41_001898 [Gigaspora margarita]|uniref:F-box domain-containing protein n=1 Tax=Gigaspora margarita TaxID=4874 RepID=A0A8H4A8N9_GIGMA|nr:hypothetical protein F8M41_001898 [Gigaspora margarita]
MTPKILMGDMPELMEYILKNLNDEIYSLYSCALVSRHWCKMSIPILWQDPFSFYQRNPLFISNYFSSLGEYEKIGLKESLKERGINEEFSKTLFDYARFLKVLDLINLECKVKKWSDLKLLSYERLINHINNLLLKLFIESGATLYELGLRFSRSFQLKPEIFYSLGRNGQFFSRIQHLTLGVISIMDIESITTLLRALAENTTKIRTLELVFHSDTDSQICHALIYVIKLQERLRLFRIAGGHTEFYGIISALEYQKNSLQEVVIQDCSFNAEFNVLNNCKNLETIRILCCNTELLKILDYKISTLEVFDTPINAQTMALILEKAGILLQRLIVESITIDEDILEESLLLEAIKSFCPNITYFKIRHIEFSTQLLELIEALDDNIRKEVEAKVALVPDYYIIVDC